MYVWALCHSNISLGSLKHHLGLLIHSDPLCDIKVDCILVNMLGQIEDANSLVHLILEHNCDDFLDLRIVALPDHLQPFLYF